MPPSNICWGIEVGYGAVKALKLQGDGDDLQVLDFAVVPHAKVLSTPDLDRDDATRVALGALANRIDVSGAQVAVSLPGHQSFARFAKLPPVEPKKVPDIVKFEAVQQIPFPLEEVEWDYQTFASEDSPEVEVGIFAVTRKRIMDLLTMLGDVGITPDLATLSPIAAYNAIAYDLEFTEKTPGTILLDIGSVATDLIIADSGRVWVRTFPIGGHQFTEALVNTFKLSYTKAEKLKREAEQTKHARHVFQAMRPVFGDLVQEIQRSIGYYQSLHPEAELKRLIGLGSTFRLPGLRKYLKQQLQLDVYRLEQFKQLGFEGPQAAEFQNASLNLATAYGLAIQGIGRGTLQANLMPVAVVREAMWKRKTPWFGAAAGLAAAAAGAMFIRPLLDSSQLTAASPPNVIKEAANTASALAKDAEQAGVTGSASADLRADRIVDLLEGRQLYSRILAETAEMIRAANERAQGDEKIELPEGEPAFTLISIDARYRGTGDGDTGVASSAGGYAGGAFDESAGYDDPRFTQGADPAGGRFGSRTTPSGGAPDEGEALAEIAGKRRVLVRVDVATASSYPYVVDDTLVAWLKERASAGAGEGYSVFVSARPWVKTGTIAPGASGSGSSGRTQGRPTGRTDPRFGGADPGTGFVGDPGARRTGDPSSLAPIEAPQSERDIERQGYTLTWYAVLDPIDNAGVEEQP